MIKEALEYLMNAGKTEVIEINNQKYTTKNVIRVTAPTPEEIKTTTLTGLIDYIKANKDCFVPEDRMIHVRSEHTVELLSPIRHDATRICHLVCEAKTPILRLNTYLDQESFNVMLQSCFLDVADRARVLSVISNIKEENVKNTSDDGVSQTVVARAGVTTVDYVQVPNPVKLVPFRTFIEVEQPESKFILRLKDGPQAALFEADGGEWRLAAMLRIKAYLEDKLPGITVLA